MNATGHPQAAYIAGIIDALATLRLRHLPGSELPAVAVNGDPRIAQTLATLTGVKTVTTRRAYARHRCTEHCPDRHDQIQSISARWEVVGTRATIMLANVAPHLVIQRDAALELIAAGRTVGWKGNVLRDMRELGWAIPDLKPQPRANARAAS